MRHRIIRGFVVESRRLGDLVLPTSAEHQAELELEHDRVVPFACVEAIARVHTVFPGARVETLTIRGRR